VALSFIARGKKVEMDGGPGRAVRQPTKGEGKEGSKGREEVVTSKLSRPETVGSVRFALRSVF
jgi:hypothetical protein